MAARAWCVGPVLHIWRGRCLGGVVTTCIGTGVSSAGQKPGRVQRLSDATFHTTLLPEGDVRGQPWGGEAAGRWPGTCVAALIFPPLHCLWPACWPCALQITQMWRQSTHRFLALSLCTTPFSMFPVSVWIQGGALEHP